LELGRSEATHLIIEHGVECWQNFTIRFVKVHTMGVVA
jgi:hypothetical protein